MKFPDKFNLTPDQNRRYARMNFDRLVHTASRFEGVNTTLPQTKTIMQGMGVTGVSIDDINTIVNLKRGWELVTTINQPLSIDLEKQINTVVAAQDALIPGEFRTGQGAVDMGEDTFEPNPVDSEFEGQWLNSLVSGSKTGTEKAMELLYHDMRGQLFWDGNKRTALLAANKLMIDSGAGLINVPLTLWEEWNNLITEFYKTDDMADLKKWTYKNGIQGPVLG
ncbi:hypothetical protein Lp19_1199 [Lactiplantibacillus plantarum]|uniref:Fido domain-containing protein n=1 Tax=Lactiplantibacillus plantarum TaxID=1590 RepID=A0A165RVN2_LACPN|nr:Fic family protein [Lactiplantibacillus plantarum]KZU95920.1 hypothetical protein Lp19_1199 [Lactiplantibacillus plantarum]